MKFRAALVAGLIAVSGCTTTGFGAKPGLGVTPVSTGQKKSATEIIDAMAGGLIGGVIGKGLDVGERRKGLEAEYRALEYTQSGQEVAWKGTSEGRSGAVVPAQPYRVGSQDCRQYTHTVMIDGRSQTARGTACRNTDGSWTTLN